MQGCELDSTSSGPCEHDNEPSGSIKAREYLWPAERRTVLYGIRCHRLPTCVYRLAFLFAAQDKTSTEKKMAEYDVCERGSLKLKGDHGVKK